MANEPGNPTRAQVVKILRILFKENATLRQLHAALNGGFLDAFLDGVRLRDIFPKLPSWVFDATGRTSYDAKAARRDILQFIAGHPKCQAGDVYDALVTHYGFSKSALRGLLAYLRNKQLVAMSGKTNTTRYTITSKGRQFLDK